MKKTSASAPTADIDLRSQPGHSIRRLQQIAFAVFMQEAASAGTTPVQYAVLQTLADQPGVDQRTLARAVSLDTSTIGGVVDRLEARALLVRSLSPQDRRVRLLHLTDAGEALRRELLPTMLQAQQRMLDPLTAAEREAFMDMVQRVIAHHAGVDDTATPEG
jgi:DNA-binding MarR family transcriptional regulator